MNEYQCIYCGENNREHLIITYGGMGLWCESCGKFDLLLIEDPIDPEIWQDGHPSERDWRQTP